MYRHFEHLPFLLRELTEVLEKEHAANPTYLAGLLKWGRPFCGPSFGGKTEEFDRRTEKRGKEEERRVQ